MILRNCEWVKEPAEEPEKVPRKRLATDARAAASRANGAKSIGPITDTGRANVKFNAVQHGATCKEILFLEGEDQGAFWAKVDRTVKEERAEGELEIEAIKTATYSRVTKARAINAQTIAVTESMTQIEDHYDDRKLVEVSDLIPEIVKAPEVAVTKLMNSTRGCSFLIREFTSLEQRLLTHHSFEVSQREYCLQLAGHRPDELFTDPVVRELNRSYLGSLQGPGFFTIAMAANALMYDRPGSITETEYTRRMEPLVTDLPTVEQGWAQLKKFVRDRIARLQERKELMGYREQRELDAAIGAAQSPCDRDAEKRQRYVSQSDRTFNAAVRLLLALKQERRKYGDRCGEDRNDNDESTPADLNQERHQAPSAGPATGEMDPQPDVIPAVNDHIQNEPETTQVVGPVGGNNPSSAAPAVSPPAPVPSNHDAAVAIVEKYKNEFAHLREFDHLE